ncbi:MAG: replicative DNA helicase, partial [Deltaproteobacteria bacterium CG17_big_fil_post_rev_8_21_14_2_50_51_6]
GEIEQDADLVVFIHRPAQGEKRAEWTFDEAELIVAKNRNGPTGRAELLYLPELTRFFNAERSKR